MSRPQNKRFTVFPPLPVLRGRAGVGALPRHRGVTLVEILIVLGVILVLLAILLPTLARVRRQAIKTKEQQALESFKVALEQYQVDWRDYPQIAATLSIPKLYDADATSNTALQTPIHEVHMEDGAKALFSALCLRLQLRAGSQPYGPYINMANFSVDTTNHWLLDPNGQPYIYIPATAPASVITQNNRFVAFLSLSSANLNNSPMYNWAAVPIIPGTMPQQRYITQQDMQVMLGDTNKNAKIDNNEQASTTYSFLLWAAGLDQKFGLATTGPNIGKTDDVTNFPIPQNLQQ
jgi:prepilin-type N-terminal cleavage/methylation domain-containing protein